MIPSEATKPFTVEDFEYFLSGVNSIEDSVRFDQFNERIKIIFSEYRKRHQVVPKFSVETSPRAHHFRFL